MPKKSECAGSHDSHTVIFSRIWEPASHQPSAVTVEKWLLLSAFQTLSENLYLEVSDPESWWQGILGSIVSKGRAEDGE